jgi:hypothetical protein
MALARPPQLILLARAPHDCSQVRIVDSGEDSGP